MKDWFQGQTVEQTSILRGERPKLRKLVSLVIMAGALALLILGLVAHFTPARAAELYYPTRMEQLFHAAVKYSGYEQKCMARPAGCPMPSVILIEIEDANIGGQFDYKDPTKIEVNVGNASPPGSLTWNAVIVHEFVHYLQWLHGELGPTSRCEDMPRIEGQAYKAGSMYLRQFGIVKDFDDQMGSVLMMAAMCMSSGY